VTPPTVLAMWPGSEDLAERAGQCYTLAMEFVLYNLDRFGRRMFLVHGLLHPDRAEGMRHWPEMHGLPLPPVNPHAWVEIEGSDGVICCDPVIRQAWERREFERLYAAETFKRYRSDIAFEVAARNDSYGPWDRRSLAEHAKRCAIAEADPRYSQRAAIGRFAAGEAGTR
jgi:hypothetical protein